MKGGITIKIGKHIRVPEIAQKLRHLSSYRKYCVFGQMKNDIRGQSANAWGRSIYNLMLNNFKLKG